MLSDRLVKARKKLGFTSREDFANALNMPFATLRSYEQGKIDSVPHTFLQKLNEQYNIHIDWLLTGKGEMIVNDSYHFPVAIPAHPEDDENTVELNYYPDIVAAAGYGGINEYEFRKQTMKLDRAFLEQFLNIRRFDCLDIITVFGNSMEPFISNGETVILDRINDARNGETVIANINGDIYIKRIKKDPLNRWVKFLSDNNEYDEIELKGKELEYVTIIGIVRAKIRTF
jgi:phage repressor protein C with HTH and peptisase S24 domain